jgi:hypothetical protein
VEKPWAAVNWLELEGFGWRAPEGEATNHTNCSNK